jgi:hypothetical protein
MSSQSLRAGAAQADITPTTSQFLYGYPHVERMSTGVHDPLYAQALYVTDGNEQAMFIGNDLVWVPKPSVLAVRNRIEEKTGIPARHIIVSGSHTHSGPIVNKSIVTRADSVVPDHDTAYVAMMEDRIVEAAVAAHVNAAPAKIGLARADATGIGTNRHDPAGPSTIDNTPVLVVKDADSDKLRALMVVCAMHPTVMHEDSKLVSGDFPGMTRQYLRQQLGDDVVFVYHMGTAGNQSPRHVTKANTFDEAKRIGGILGQAIIASLDSADCVSDAAVRCSHTMVDLPVRDFPPVDVAETGFKQATERLEHLRSSGAPRTEVRTAECDWFGAEELVTFAKAALSGDVAERVAQLSPTEVPLIAIGDWKFIGWAGEVFVEYGQEIAKADPNAIIITTAGGDLQGYLVTQEGIDKKWYEANNALFQSPASPEKLVEASKQLLNALN